MPTADALIIAFCAFAGTFALVSIFHDLRAAWAQYLDLMKGPTDDD